MREASQVLAQAAFAGPRFPEPLLRWAGALGATGLVLGRVAAGRGSIEGFSQWSQRLLAALKVKVEVEGRIPEGQLWVSNHLSWLDPMVLMAQRPMGTLAKCEVATYPLIGRGAAKAGLRFVDREDPLSRAAAVVAFMSDLSAGRPYLLFPEGTTTRGERLAPLWRGGLLAAHALGVTVLPVRLESADPHYPWTGDEALLPHLNVLSRLPETCVRVVPGEPLGKSTVSDGTEFIARVAAHLQPRT